MDVAGVDDWNNGAARDVDLKIGAILGHPTVTTRCPPAKRGKVELQRHPGGERSRAGPPAGWSGLT